MAKIRASSEKNGSRQLVKKQANTNQYVAVSDLMAILSELADADLENGDGDRAEPTSKNPRHSQRIRHSQPPVASLPQGKSPTPPGSASPTPTPPLPTLSTSLNGDRATLDVEAMAMESSALSPTQPEEKTLAELTRELWELKLVALSDNDYYNRQLGRLKNRFLWLAGLSLGTILALGFVLGWLVANLKGTQIQLANYEGNIKTHRARLDRLEGRTLESVETALRSLQDQIPATLDTDLENTQEDITALKVQLRDMELKLAAHDKALSVLVSALQGIVR